jgi:hypothetical protein
MEIFISILIMIVGIQAGILVPLMFGNDSEEEKHITEKEIIIANIKFQIIILENEIASYEFFATYYSDSKYTRKAIIKEAMKNNLQTKIKELV